MSVLVTVVSLIVDMWTYVFPPSLFYTDTEKMIFCRKMIDDFQSVHRLDGCSKFSSLLPGWSLGAFTPAKVHSV
jgi:hypothetical protein